MYKRYSVIGSFVDFFWQARFSLIPSLPEAKQRNYIKQQRKSILWAKGTKILLILKTLCRLIVNLGPTNAKVTYMYEIVLKESKGKGIREKSC